MDPQRELGELSTKMDAVLDKLKDVEARLRDLEKFKWKVAGAALVVGSAAGTLAKLLG